MEFLISKIVVIICFIALIVVLFDEKKDYLVYSILIVVIAGLFTANSIDEAKYLDNYVYAIQWNVIFFLIAMFAIVEILKEALLFHYIAKIIVNKYRNNIRKMFWFLCTVSTLSAAIIEDLSVAIIFIPILIETCREINISPRPFLLGMTICINLASTLTPFGSAENIMIAGYFDINLPFFLKYVSLYFVIATICTLFLLDKFLLKKEMGKKWFENDEKKDCISQLESKKGDYNKIEILQKIEPTKKSLRKNFIGLIVFVFLLIIIPQLYLAGIIGMLFYIFLNPIKGKNGKKRPNITEVFKKVDYKLIYFFMCLFILVYLMELNGFIRFLGEIIEKFQINGIFTVSIFILLLTSVLSGLLDNAPVTILFLPIIDFFLSCNSGCEIPFIIAMILGINLGGNFLPQGSAADMMTLELSEKFCVKGITYKSLTKIGGLFALLHIVLGIGYLALVIYVFPFLKKIEHNTY